MATAQQSSNETLWEKRGWQVQPLPIPRGYGSGESGHPLQQLRLLKPRKVPNCQRLVVVLHGLQFPGGLKVNTDAYRSLLSALFSGSSGQPPADLLLVDYPNHLRVRRAVADALSPAIGAAIEQHGSPYEAIVLLGHSFGSLLARRVLVDAAEQRKEWCRKTLALIVLAGSNLGFKLQKVDDMRVKLFSLISGVSDKLFPWLADALVYWGWGRLLSYGWRNSAWIVDTRIKWLRLYEGESTFLEANSKNFRTLYMAGAMDQYVGQDDLQMVYQFGGYYCNRVIGDRAGDAVFHEDFLDAPRGLKSVAQRLAEDAELRQLIGRDLGIVLGEDQPPEPETGWQKIERVSELHHQPGEDRGGERAVVFLIHGIRDNAEWQENIDYHLRSLRQRLQISQVRYGYFNALQFLFPSERQRAVRSFSDEYFRVMARFPDLKQENIHVYAHSNGTFVFAQALKKYAEIKVNRVLIGGSVLPSGFPWKRFVSCRPSLAHGDGPESSCNKQVMELLNYAANQDWPTGFLCRGLSYLPGFDGPLLGVGPGGTDGFRDLRNFNDPGAQSELRGWNFFLKGGHGATLEPGADGPRRIAEYLLQQGRPGHDDFNCKTTIADLDLGNEPFHPRAKAFSYPSFFRGWKGTLLAVSALILFFILLLSLLGLLAPFADGLQRVFRELARTQLGAWLFQALAPLHRVASQLTASLSAGFQTAMSALVVATINLLPRFVVEWGSACITAISLAVQQLKVAIHVAFAMLLAYLLSRF